MTGRFWLGSLWFYQTPEAAPDVDRCTAGVQLEAGIGDAKWVDNTHVIVGLDTGQYWVFTIKSVFSFALNTSQIILLLLDQ